MTPLRPGGVAFGESDDGRSPRENRATGAELAQRGVGKWTSQGQPSRTERELLRRRRGKKRKFGIGIVEGARVVIVCQEEHRNTALDKKGRNCGEKSQRGAPDPLAENEPFDTLHGPLSPSAVIAQMWSLLTPPCCDAHEN
jgi:hypothetical protein